MINHLTTMVGLDCVVFYTVWSRQRGAGKVLVLDLLNFMLEIKPERLMLLTSRSSLLSPELFLDIERTLPET